MEQSLAVAAVTADYRRIAAAAASAAAASKDKELRMTEDQRKYLFERAKSTGSNKAVVADMKAKFNTWVSGLFAREQVADAVSQATTSSAPELRKRKVLFIVEAVTQASRDVVLGSWSRTGISRVLFGDAPAVVLFDLYKAAFTAAADDLDTLQINEADEPEEVRRVLADAAIEAAEGHAVVELPAAAAAAAASAPTADGGTAAAGKRGRPAMTTEEKAAAKNEREKKCRTAAAKGTPTLMAMFAKKPQAQPKKSEEAAVPTVGPAEGPAAGPVGADFF